MTTFITIVKINSYQRKDNKAKLYLMTLTTNIYFYHQKRKKIKKTIIALIYLKIWTLTSNQILIILTVKTKFLVNVAANR